MANNNSYGDDDPIAAFATIPGNSALTLIRCSGKSSIDLISSVFTPEKIKNVEGNTVIHGWIVSGEEIEREKIDEVLLTVFRAPKSYTGEDSVDICCHGGFVTGKAVMETLKRAGFRDALRGEFTFRAFVNGKIDLTRCESVMELVSAKTETGRGHAVSRLCGSLQKEINELKQLLVQVLAGAEIYLDYSEDEISAEFDADAKDEIAGKLPNREIAQNVFIRLKKLSDSWNIERVYQEGVTVVIAGKPNTGKSSLFNLLLKEDRSIVTEVPGTTRDWIEAWVSIEGIPVRLVDTAGLRETADSVEKIGVERSQKLLQEADLVLYLIEKEELVAEFFDNLGVINFNVRQIADQICLPKYIFVWNKCDIAALPNPFPIAKISPVCVSAKTGEGYHNLYSAIAGAINAQAASLDARAAALGTVRQKKLVDSACAAVEEALSLADREEPLDLIAPLVREAVNALGEITGEVSSADILDEMFSKFCVGK